MAVNNITADAKNEWFERICVFGGGLMGAGIASVCAFYGRSITVVDMDGKALSQAKQRVHFGLNKMLEAAQEEMPRSMTTLEQILDRVRFTVDLARAVADAQLIIECIPENLEAKKRLLSRIEEHCPRDALLATNTSSLRIADIGHGLRAMEEGRFAGMHFFNPVPKMRLVEVIPSAKMSQQLMSRLVTFVKSIGKEPVICKDTPGFIANRILLTMLSEAIGLVERQVASSEEVDKVCQLGLGLPIGPFRLLDFIGLDTVANIIAGWAQHYQEEYPNLRQSKVLNQLVAEGKLGRKTGQGFYEYGNSNSKL